MLLGQFGARGVALVEDAPATRQEQLALGGEGDAARAAVEQAYTERLFQPGYALAGGRGGDALYAAGVDEAAGVRGVDEGLQVGQVVEDGHGEDRCERGQGRRRQSGPLT
ncbi:hypothetical protein D3C72_1734880 [compost metagenome]